MTPTRSRSPTPTTKRSSSRHPTSWGWIWPLLAVLWVTALSRPLGSIPPLGAIFDIHSGIWQHHEFAWKDRKIPELKSAVHIAVDQNGVPHIFAGSEADLYLAQGYLMAAQRLFQMDLSSRSTAGRLTELVGEKGLEMDRFFIRFGMRQSIMKTVNEYMQDPQTAAMINAFVRGVNTYIDQLDDLPVEYKLLQARPEHFDAARVIAMARALTFNLSGNAQDLDLTQLRQKIGLERVLDLFPEFYPDRYSDYVLPGKWGKPRRPEKNSDFQFETHIRDFPSIPHPPPNNGSNNWVVGPKKSTTGHSLLANDTHLGYTLPNIWFENQLSCPEFNVYGVSLVNVPGIINGFTAQTAWGPTNGTTDALDYYEVEFSDENSLTYKDGELQREALQFSETISNARGPLETVQVLWTKWGPLLYREGRYGLVANWTGFHTKNELLALRHLYDSKSVKECLKAFNDWGVPIQNFVCADPDHIGILHAGFVPKRTVGEGRFIEAAGSSQWNLNEPVGAKDRLLRIDPPQSYLRSANERIVDNTYDNYMGSKYEEPFRGSRIRERLEAKAKLSGQDLIDIQNDDLDGQARMALPQMLKAVARAELSGMQREWLEKLDHWDYHDAASLVEPSLYKSWFKHLKNEIFVDEVELANRRHFMPPDIRVIWMLDRVASNPEDSDSQWIDDKRTVEKETLSQIVTRALKKSWEELEKEHGRDPGQWTWTNYNHAQIPHIARLPGFGSGLLAMNGSGQSVRGNRGWHGPVYKFVIELGAEPKAWMQVPGGMNGDPLSRDWGRDVEDWAAGKMHPVEFYKDWSESQKHAVHVMNLSPGEG